MFKAADARWRGTLYRTIFESETPAGKAFDVALILLILASVVVVTLDSVAGFRALHGPLLRRMEWGFTLLFTLEYLVRLTVVARPRKYAFSFFGIVDLLAIAPSYLSLLVPGAQALLIIRVVRILRVFHVLGLSGHEGAARTLVTAMRTARYPITVFLLALAVLVVSLGTLMYIVESAAGDITSIPLGIYWAVVTLTTLGYGDLVPVTALGRGLTTGIVILGYWAIAVPVAVISMELARAGRSDTGSTGSILPGSQGADNPSTDSPEEGGSCPSCGSSGHQGDARWCRLCGASLDARGT